MIVAAECASCFASSLPVAIDKTNVVNVNIVANGDVVAIVADGDAIAATKAASGNNEHNSQAVHDTPLPSTQPKKHAPDSTSLPMVVSADKPRMACELNAYVKNDLIISSFTDRPSVYVSFHLPLLITVTTNSLASIQFVNNTAPVPRRVASFTAYEIA